MLRILTLQLVTALAADAENLDRLAFAFECLDVLARATDNIRVERTAEAAVGGRHDHEMYVVFSCADQKGRSPGILLQPARQTRNHCAHFFRVGARGFRRLLRAAQVGRGDHLHRLGDFPDRLHACDPVAVGFEAGHQAKVFTNSSTIIFNCDSVSGVICFLLRISSSTFLCLPRISRISSPSKRCTSNTASLSR